MALLIRVIPILLAIASLGDASFMFQTLQIRASGERCPETSCEHGGRCNVTSRTCSCPPGYAGNLCEYPVCNVACQNNGTCAGPNHCHCPPSYKGKQCEECTSYGRQQCQHDPMCAVYEETSGECCPACRHHYWRNNCVPGTCRPVSGCMRYEYESSEDCCPRCVRTDPRCLDSVPCELEPGCIQHALSVPSGKCCPRCERYRCSGIECPAVLDCIKYAAPLPGQCCRPCLARRESCPGISCPAVPNCAAYIQRPNMCCAKCKRTKPASKRIPADHGCSTVQCPSTMECQVKGQRAVCRCRRRCPKRRRTTCGSDGILHRNRCRLLRSACLKGVTIRPVQMAFCTYYGPRIQKTLVNLQRMMKHANANTNPVTLLGGLL
ncbi:platelet endothelial aggregation receptor 1-like [Sycon ciliatum]|uniref:platelet endothelial aggregation receptor 1-like n=1 Tax=Sycon ciliatum TaxID=27933 RepID=UPI0031F6F949